MDKPNDGRRSREAVMKTARMRHNRARKRAEGIKTSEADKATRRAKTKKKKEDNPAWKAECSERQAQWYRIPEKNKHVRDRVSQRYHRIKNSDPDAYVALLQKGRERNAHLDPEKRKLKNEKGRAYSANWLARIKGDPQLNQAHREHKSLRDKWYRRRKIAREKGEDFDEPAPPTFNEFLSGKGLAPLASLQERTVLVDLYTPLEERTLRPRPSRPIEHDTNDDDGEDDESDEEDYDSDHSLSTDAESSYDSMLFSYTPKRRDPSTFKKKKTPRRCQPYQKRKSTTAWLHRRFPDIEDRRRYNRERRNKAKDAITKKAYRQRQFAEDPERVRAQQRMYRQRYVAKMKAQGLYTLQGRIHKMRQRLKTSATAIKQRSHQARWRTKVRNKVYAKNRKLAHLVRRV